MKNSAGRLELISSDHRSAVTASALNLPAVTMHLATINNKDVDESSLGIDSVGKGDARGPVCDENHERGSEGRGRPLADLVEAELSSRSYAMYSAAATNKSASM